MKKLKAAKDIEFKDLEGKILKEVKKLPSDQKEILSWWGGKVDGDILLFRCEDADYIMHHERDCCESVDLIDGFEDLQEIVGAKIISAEEVESEEHQGVEGITEKEQDSFTWTFYKIQTEKGFATLRWFGSSNGYYSEKVSFHLVEDASEAV